MSTCILTARMTARSIPPSQTLMVGDRLDNDIEPARAHGWQTSQFSPCLSG
ncbi:MAG: HAD hydrolase-like protein [Verrucomicrobiota bacterium]